MQAESKAHPSGHRSAVIRPKILFFLSACLAFALALSAAPPAQAASSQKIDIGKWRRLETESFTVYTNADRKEAEKWVRELEGFSKVLHVLFPGLNPEPLRPLRLYLFAKNRSFDQYVANSSRLAGFFTRRPRMSLMVVDGGSGFSPAPTLYHEYTHYVLRNNLPYLPQWIDEGLAEYFETFAIERNKARFGHVHRGWSRHLQSSTWMPIEEVLEVTTRSEAYRDPSKTLDFRSQAWALVDFLFEREQGRREQTLKLFQLLDSGASSADALQQAFGTSLAEIQSKLKKNVMFADRKIQVLDLKMLPASRDIEVHNLDHDEALVRLGELLMVGGEAERAKAQVYFDDVLSRKEDVQALVGVGILQLSNNDPESALETLDRALKIAPNAGVYFYAGNAYLRQFDTQDGKIPGFGQTTSPLILKARESYKKALELDPRMTDAYNLIGHTYLYDAGSPQPGITLTETVLAKVPNIVLALTVIELHSRKGDQAAAYRVRDTQLERMVGSQSHQSVDWVDKALVVADLILADAWRMQGREQEARDLVKGLEGKVDDEEITERIAQWRQTHDPSVAGPEAP